MRLIDADKLKEKLHNFFDGKVIDEPAYILRDVFCHIDNAQAVDEWIPVSERLPEEDGVYLVTLEIENSEFIDMAMFIYSEKDCCNNGFHKAYTVIAWQPLPESYKRGEEE